MGQVIELTQGFIRLTQMMEQVTEWIQRFISQVDTGDGTGNRIDPGVHQVDRQTINLPRMVGARRRQAINPLWQWNRIT